MSPQTPALAFHNFSRGIAENFLQTVLVVDDKARTPMAVSTQSESTVPAATEIVSASNRKSVGKSNTKAAATSKVDKLDTEVLRIKDLNQVFAEKGIVCGFLSPASKGGDRKEIITAAEKTAKRADIIILDWKMEEGDVKHNAGYTATKIISGVLTADAGTHDAFQPSGRLRLIVIYSQTRHLKGIMDNLEKALKKLKLSTPFDRSDDFTLRQDSTCICAFKKSEGTPVKNTDLASRTLDELQLPNRLIDEFTLLTKGLLSNVAIAALSALRANTHKILQKFHPDLDVAYLNHRAWTDPVEETQEHPIALIASEMQDVLAGNEVTKAISADQIRLWARSLPENIKLKIKDMNHDVMLNLLADTIIFGHKYSAGDNKWKNVMDGVKKGHSASKFTALMLTDNATNEDKAKQKDREFAMLTTVRSHYNAPPPYLTLGTIIFIVNTATKENEYYVCIQPVCDCVRIDSERNFPFLKLTHVLKGKFDLVIKNQDEFVDLKVDYKAFNSITLRFAPKERQIKAAKPKDRWVFAGKNGAGKSVRCLWVADLKPAHAQRIAELFGGELSRVGLTESEWLRRMAGQEDDK